MTFRSDTFKEPNQGKSFSMDAIQTMRISDTVERIEPARTGPTAVMQPTLWHTAALDTITPPLPKDYEFVLDRFESPQREFTAFDPLDLCAQCCMVSFDIERSEFVVAPRDTDEDKMHHPPLRLLLPADGGKFHLAELVGVVHLLGNDIEGMPPLAQTEVNFVVRTPSKTSSVVDDYPAELNAALATIREQALVAFRRSGMMQHAPLSSGKTQMVMFAGKDLRPT